MKKHYVIFLLSLISVGLKAQDAVQYQNVAPGDTLAADTAWKVGGNFGLQFTQASYQYWQAGGVNSIAGNTIFSIFANYDNGGRWSWVNSLDIAYGLNFQDTVYNKTDDRLEIESRVDRNIGDHWNLSALVNFRTQFTNGYAKPGERGDSVRISAFMAPGYLVTALGFTYKPNQKFSLFLSPLTSKMTFVNDQRLADKGAFGVDPAKYDSINGEWVRVEKGSTFRQEVGGYLNLAYKTPLVTNVDMQFKLGLFSNYLDNQYKFIDVNSELQLFLKVNKYISANIALNLIYDNDVLVDTNGDGKADAPRTQFKEVLGVGFAYNFGYQPKKK